MHACVYVFAGQSVNLLMLKKIKPTPVFLMFAGQALNPLGSEKRGFLYVSALVVFICMCVYVCVCVYVMSGC